MTFRQVITDHTILVICGMCGTVQTVDHLTDVIPTQLAHVKEHPACRGGAR